MAYLFEIRKSEGLFKNPQPGISQQIIYNDIILGAEKIDFRQELGAFLPADQQAIIRDFQRALSSELNRQLSGN